MILKIINPTTRLFKIIDCNNYSYQELAKIVVFYCMNTNYETYFIKE